MQITRVDHTKKKLLQGKEIKSKNKIEYVSDEELFAVSNSLLSKNLQAYEELAK